MYTCLENQLFLQKNAEKPKSCFSTPLTILAVTGLLNVSTSIRIVKNKAANFTFL